MTAVNDILKKVNKTIKHFDMLKPGERVGVAVSGGSDSVTLLHVMARIAKDFNLTIRVIHLNHGLRGEESDNEEAFVRNLAGSMKIPVDSKKISIPLIMNHAKGSLEDICRKERYKYFEETARRYRLDKITLGHNLNDQAETVIMKFLRGSGLEGLKGMLPFRDGKYIRPLIEISKEEILLFLKRERLHYATDSSNMDNSYLRNKIRNELIPELMKHYNPRLLENIGHVSHIIRQENDLIKDWVDTILASWDVDYNKKDLTIHIPQLNALHPALRSRVIKTLIEDRNILKKEMGYVHVKAAIDLIEGKNPSGVLNLPGGVTIKRVYDNLLISKKENVVQLEMNDADRKNKNRHKDDKREGNDYYYAVDVPGSVYIREIGRKISFDLITIDRVDFTVDNAVFMDYNSLSFPLVVRSMKPGDRIQPIGMKGTKKVKALFIDEKIARNERISIPLLVDLKSVLWIPGVKLSEKAKITDRTDKVIMAEII